jgi:hypothetical protein
VHRQPFRPAVAGWLLVAAAVTTACSPSPSTVDGTAEPSSSGSTIPASGSPIASRVELPAGFPVLPGAVAEMLPAGEPGTIARWSSDQDGPVAFEFYVDALPAAGYRTIGLFPGGAVAVILFQTPSGERWELVLTLDDEGGTRIEVRTAQP